MGNQPSRGYQHPQAVDEEAGGAANQFTNANNSLDTNNANQNGAPNNNGLFFGTHHVLNANPRLVANETETFLFGGGVAALLPTAAAAGARPAIAHGRQLRQAETVRSCVHIHKETIQLIRSESCSSHYFLQFKFDAAEDCIIKVLLIACEERNETQHTTTYRAIGEVIPPVTCSRGLGQTYLQSREHPLDISRFSPEELEHNPKTRTFPVVITIERSAPTDPPAATSGLVSLTTEKQKLANEVSTKAEDLPAPPKEANSQTVLCTLLHCNDGSYAIKALKSTMLFNGKTYLIHDIYGVNPTEEFGRECVVCMTEARDTIVLPCRHMCLCSGCAEVLRFQTNKCPICRSPGVLLKVRVIPALGSEDDLGKAKKSASSISLSSLAAAGSPTIATTTTTTTTTVPAVSTLSA